MTLQETSTGLDLSRPLLNLITRGRKTRIPHVVSVRFVHRGGSIYVLPGRTGSDWVRNALADRWAKVRIGERVSDVSVDEGAPSELAEVLHLFRSKYGGRLTADWYSKSPFALRLTPVGPTSRRGGVTGEGDVKTTFAEWKTRNGDYYSGVAEAFDSASEEYDFTIRGNFINRWIRERSIKELLRLAGRDDTLLEIGCGTGAEALEISRHVAGIVATDISPRMVSLLARKVDAKGLGTRVTPLRLGAGEISRASGFLPYGKTRLAYSFNGALNCEPSIETFPLELSKVIEDRGYFLCSIRNTFCLSEALAHAAVLQFDKMAPRKKQPIMVSVGGMDIPSLYYRPGPFAKLFRPHFRVRRMVGLPAILPPAYLSDRYFRARRILSFAERLETVVAHRFPLNRMGDQTLLVFQKT